MSVTPDSLWDMASLTKIMVTTPSIMILYDRGLIELEEVACKYLPEFGSNGKHLVTIRQLLTHTAGLREFHHFFDMGFKDRKEVLDYIMNDKLWYTAGAGARYSDLSMIVLGLIVERISGVSLEDFAAEELFEPLGMRHTMFRPTEFADFDMMVVPTEVDCIHRNRLLWGEVHDPTAFLLGGVAGHAGLFSTIIDVCRFAKMILAGGMDIITNRRLFRETTVRLFVTPDLQTSINTRPFALGWDVALRTSLDGYTSAGTYLGPATFGHIGFTGTSLWIDPDRDLFVALLTNAVHPTAVGGFGSKLREVRTLIADAAVYAMDELGIPQRSLSWQVDVHSGYSGSQSIHHAGVVDYSNQPDTRTQNLSTALSNPSHVDASCEQLLSGHSQCPDGEGDPSSRYNSKDSSHEVFALANRATCAGREDICEQQGHSSQRRNLVPFFLLAIFVSMNSK